jgi:hypothetical protein
MLSDNVQSIKLLLCKDAEDVRNCVATLPGRFVKKRIRKFTKEQIMERWRSMIPKRDTHIRISTDVRTEETKDEQSKLSALKDKAGGIVEASGEKVTSAIDFSKEKVVAAVDFSKEKIGEAVDLSKTAASTAANAVVETSKTVLSTSKNVIVSGADLSKNTVKKGASKVSLFFGAVKSKFSKSKVEEVPVAEAPTEEPEKPEEKPEEKADEKPEEKLEEKVEEKPIPEAIPAPKKSNKKQPTPAE